MNILFILILIPVLASIFISFLKDEKTIKKISLTTTIILFFLSIYTYYVYDTFSIKLQFSLKLPWINSLHIDWIQGVDAYSLFFVILTTFLIPICLLLSWQSIKFKIKEYAIAFLMLESLLLCVFTVLDLLLFYVFFESILIPMFLIIGIWGARERKIHAAYQFFLYTLLGSVLMLLGILIIYYEVGTTDIQVLLINNISENKQKLLWLAFFASFAVKVPMVPVHIWLPE